LLSFGAKFRLGFCFAVGRLGFSSTLGLSGWGLRRYFQAAGLGFLVLWGVGLAGLHPFCHGRVVFLACRGGRGWGFRVVRQCGMAGFSGAGQ